MKSKLLKVTLALFATAWAGGAQAEVKTIFTRTLWTFNDLTYTASNGDNPFPSNSTSGGANIDLNGKGLLYTGGTGSSLATVSSTDIAFSEGTEVTGITKVIELQEQTSGWASTSPFNSQRTGENYNSTLQRAMAFNTTVPGTTYVIFKRTGSYKENKNFEIWFNYKSSSWTATSATKTIENNSNLVEVSLHGEAAGTFWVRANTKSQVYAILFIPDPVNVTVGEHLYTTYYNSTAYNQELPEGLTAYGVSSQVSARTGQTVTLSPYNVIPAGAGVILKGSEVKTYALNYTKTESTYTGENYMVGTATEIAELPYHNYVLVYDSEDGKVKFARSNGDGGKPTVPAGHAYLSSAVYSAPSGARPNYLFLEDGNESTGVSAISTQTEASGTWYTLGGQRIAAPTAHGVYIKNGKKIIIK